MIAYVYIVCLFAFFLLRLATAFIIDLIGSSNFLWLRSAIARERGIAAYRAWLPLGGAAVLIQLFTPFPVLTWIGRLILLISKPA